MQTHFWPGGGVFHKLLAPGWVAHSWVQQWTEACVQRSCIGDWQYLLQNSHNFEFWWLQLGACSNSVFTWAPEPCLHNSPIDIYWRKPDPITSLFCFYYRNIKHLLQSIFSWVHLILLCSDPAASCKMITLSTFKAVFVFQMHCSA